MKLVHQLAEKNFKAQVKVYLSFTPNPKEENVFLAMFLTHNKLDISKMSKEEMDMLNPSDVTMFLYDKGIVLTPYGKYVGNALEGKLQEIRRVN